jgi:hypothetical protein
MLGSDIPECDGIITATKNEKVFATFMDYGGTEYLPVVSWPCSQLGKLRVQLLCKKY